MKLNKKKYLYLCINIIIFLALSILYVRGFVKITEIINISRETSEIATIILWLSYITLALPGILLFIRWINHRLD